MTSNLDRLAQTTNTQPPIQQPTPELRPPEPNVAPPTPQPQRSRRTKGTQPGTGATKRTVNLRMTLNSREVINDTVEAANNDIDTLAKAIIPALRATESALREQAPPPADPNDPWADETNPQRELIVPKGQTAVSISVRLSDGQYKALRKLSEDLGWSPSLVCDTAIQMHYLSK